MMIVLRTLCLGLVLSTVAAHAQVNVLTLDKMPTLDRPAHEGRSGNIKAHFVRLKSVVHPDRIADFLQDERQRFAASECALIGEPKEPMPADADERFLAYEDHYITEQFHVVYRQMRQATGACKVRWLHSRSVTIGSFNGKTCVIDLSRPQMARGWKNCSFADLQKGSAVAATAPLRLESDRQTYGGHQCRYVQPHPALGELGKMSRLCLLEVTDLNVSSRLSSTHRGLILRSQIRPNPDERYVDILEAERVELGIGVSMDVLMPYLR